MSFKALANISNSLPKAAKVISRNVVRYSPEIFTGFGIAGSIIALYLGVEAGPEVAAEKKRLKNEEGSKVAKAVKIAKPLAPALAAEGMSIACILGAHHISHRRNAALAAAYKLSEEALSVYKDSVKEVVSEDKLEEIKEKVADKKIEHMKEYIPGSVINTGHGDVLFYDEWSGRYFRSSKEFIRSVENDLNRDINTDINDFKSFNDFYEANDLGDIRFGDLLGFNLDHMIKTDFSKFKELDGEPCFILDFENDPIPYYNYYD